jgi:NAD(P)-dependent dehydrogenase (short-subunit alcohol dehydrogenase family)
VVVNKNVWITGANRGIGLALTQLYCEKGYNVFACCRKASKELIFTSATIIEGLDVTNEATFSSLDNYLASSSVDIFINNAGLLQNEVISNLSSFAKKSIEKQFKVNTLGPLYLTGYLYSYLKEGSKLVFITSRMGSIKDNTSGARYGYRMSKAALNAAVKSLSIDLKDKNIPVCLVHPGWVRTDMTGNTGNIDPVAVALQIRDRIQGCTIDNSGMFFHADGQELSW